MEYLFSELDELAGDEGQRFGRQLRADMAQADRLWIAVGYASERALRVLEQLVREQHLHEVHVILGMYYQQGIPRNVLEIARSVNDAWVQQSIGEISIIEQYLYHGKVYLFGGTKSWLCAYVGSANLSGDVVAEIPASQFEVSTRTVEPKEVQSAADFMVRLSQRGRLRRIDTVTDMHILAHNYRMRTRARNGGAGVHGRVAVQTRAEHPEPPERLSGAALYEFYHQHENPELRFALPILVPREAERLHDARGTFTRSNVNVCYAEGRLRTWWEMQVSIPANVAEREGFPRSGESFVVVLRNGVMLIAHGISGAGLPKNLSFSNLRGNFSDQVIGRWFKQIFIDAGLVQYVNTRDEDPERKQMITQEMLDEMNIHYFVLTGTGQYRNVRRQRMPVFTLHLE